ncbi:eukaryotic translation initiation factor 3 subunit 6 [Cytidiella melzeri]|nr:eukaryotic translation initiation factor 3 subunit 6 [Cytidiella melzeri]
MAQQRKALWEADLDEDFHDVDLNLAIGNYGQNGLYDDAAQPRIDEATLIAVQQQVAQQAALAAIPDPVKRFIIHFHQAVLDNNLGEITVAYESGWNRLTEKFYAKTEWPEAEVIAPLVNDDQIFLILYRELYYRHVYSRIQPDIDDRYHSYENSCELFNYLLNSDGPVPLELPEQWLWDIIDEFIYQFQSFCVWRSKVKAKTEEELMVLVDGNQVWSSYSVLNVLYSLIQKSKINEHIVALQEGKGKDEINEIVGEYGSRPLYRMLGYFSLIGLLRVHSLLGDFTLALKVMDSVELNQKSPFTRVTACHVTTYYYVGFCYIMLQRYPDAIRAFVSVLNFILRMRQYHTRSYQYDQINKTADRMYALFAICNALSPSRVDDNILNVTKERYGEQLAKMSRGEEGLPAFEELFLYACPKFISANPPPYEEAELLQAYMEDPPTEPAQRHLSLFLADVRAKAPVPTLRSFLKLYTSLDASKLANFLDADEEEMVQQLMVMKRASRSVSRMENEKGLLGGQITSTSDLDFVIDENMVNIAESTVGRRYAGWFIRSTEHAQRVLDTIRHAALPISTIKSAAPAPAHSKDTPTNATATVNPSRSGGQRVAWGASVKAV